MFQFSDLITFAKPIDVLVAIVGDVGWCGTPVVVLTTDHILSVLRRFQAGELTAADVEAWADLIECRETSTTSQNEMKKYRKRSMCWPIRS
ncbi:hypothetical protein D3227_04555 [Mesorhizobium waimense]|uniref:Uncharacterized protein n=1 Tax=Mesorhizobium waimense TaxID=1300307 RepID=A0A3A5KYQ4_9HYPH|nr:hypothetical protein D3227_04555 [Mesorhizobium waimense]